MRIPLVGGRLFERDDHAVGRANVIVSRAAAQQLWPNEDPLGKRVRYGSDPATYPWLTVVGVVGDVRLRSFRQAAPDPMIYLPMVGRTATKWVVGSHAGAARRVGDRSHFMWTHSVKMSPHGYSSAQGLVNRY